MKKLSFLLVFILFNVTFCYSQWEQIGVDVYGEAAGYYAGWSVSLNQAGNIVAVSGHHNDGSNSEQNTGWVRVLENVNGNWIQIGDEIEDGVASWSSTYPGSVSLNANGDVIAIGTPFGGNLSSGITRVFELINGEWAQIGNDIVGEANSDYSGTSVDLSADGTIVAIGAPDNAGSGYDMGHVRVFENVAGTWTQIGQDIDGENNNDKSGRSVSISANGSIVAIGAPYNNSYSGHVRVFENVSGTWTQIGQDIDGESNGNESGDSISMNNAGDVIVIGARFNSGSYSQAGQARAYQYVGGSWTQIGQDIDGDFINDYSGKSVAISGNGEIVAVGAPNNNSSTIDTGQLKIFKNTGGTWTQIDSEINGEFFSDLVGLSVSLNYDGSVVASGEPYTDGNGDQSGRVRLFGNSSVLSTESFVFDNFEIYPNPVSSFLIIKNTKNISSIRVYDVNGRILKNIDLNGFDFDYQLNVQNLKNAVYFLEIQSEKGRRQIKKFLKN